MMFDECRECGRQYKTDQTRRNRGRKFCSWACYSVFQRKKEQAEKETKPKCSVDGCGRETRAGGLCSRHYNADRAAKKIGCYGKCLCKCSQCGVQFRSQDERRFCSLACYTASDQFKELGKSLYLLGHAAQGNDLNERYTIRCWECGRERSYTPSEMRAGKAKRPIWSTRRFCSRPCYRKWMSLRFDRWFANPQTIALPQGYDEFLSMAELPCLVHGCSWTGKSLSHHMNQAHGVYADEFKRLAGFNKGTGVVAAEYAKKLSELRDGTGNSDIAACISVEASRLPRGPIRLEAREHRDKSIAIRKSL